MGATTLLVMQRLLQQLVAIEKAHLASIRITDTDQPTNRKIDPAKVLLRHEKEKKNKYGDLCIARRRTFTPLVFSIDGLLGKEATAASKRLASCLAAKWKRSYSEICGFVRSRLSIALVCSSSRCLRGDRNPTHRFHTPMWDSGTGLGLYRMQLSFLILHFSHFHSHSFSGVLNPSTPPHSFTHRILFKKFTYLHHFSTEN